MQPPRDSVLEDVRDLLNWECHQVLDRLTATCADRDKLGEPISRDVLSSPGVRRLLGASVPRAIGGRELDVVTWGRTLEEVGRTCDDLSFGLLISMFPAVANTIYDSGNEVLIDRYVRGIVDGSCFVSFAYTEATDAFDFKTSFRHDGDELVISGEKVMITGGAIADAFMTYVREDGTDDLYVIIVEARDEGVEMEPLFTMGLRSAGFARMKMREVRVPADRILVRRGGGLSHAQEFLTPRRVILSAAALGRIARTISICTEYVTRVVRYDHPLATHSSVQMKLGEMRTAYETAKVLVRRSLEVMRDNEGRGEPLDDGSSVTKLQCAQAGLEVTHKAFELMGGAAYVHPNPIERYVRDSFGAVSGAGAQDILKINTGIKTLFDSL